MNSRPIALMAFVAGLVVACGGGATASSGPTLDQFNALAARVTVLEGLVARVATLEAEVVALKGGALDDSLIIPNGASSSAKTGMRMFAAVAENDLTIGTLVGAVATNGKAKNATALEGVSSTGYLFVIGTDQGDSPTVSVEGPIYFENSNCTGRAFVSGLGSSGVVSRYGAQQGFAFRVHAGVSNEIIDNPLQYWYVPAGSVEQPFAWMSKFTNVGDCQLESGSETILMFEVQPNDQVVTGVPSGPFGGKVQLGPSS